MRRGRCSGGADRWKAVLLLFLFLSAGCAGLNYRSSRPCHEMYQPMQSPESMEFISAAFAEAEAQFGPPRIPLQQVLLRRSLRSAGLSGRYRLRENFSLTECADPAAGLFVIYLSERPDAPDYWALLAHECTHLLNPWITDWYMEGLATVFSEEFCQLAGRPWGHFLDHFLQSDKDPYALSYRMMKALKQSFPDEYPLLAQSVLPNRRGKGKWLRIDIDAWLARLPSERQGEALNIIKPYVRKLAKADRGLYDFTVPTGLH